MTERTASCAHASQPRWAVFERELRMRGPIDCADANSQHFLNALYAQIAAYFVAPSAHYPRLANLLLEAADAMASIAMTPYAPAGRGDFVGRYQGVDRLSMKASGFAFRGNVSGRRDAVEGAWRGDAILYNAQGEGLRSVAWLKVLFATIRPPSHSPPRRAAASSAWGRRCTSRSLVGR